MVTTSAAQGDNLRRKMCECVARRQAATWSDSIVRIVVKKAVLRFAKSGASRRRTDTGSGGLSQLSRYPKRHQLEQGGRKANAYLLVALMVWAQRGEVIV